MATEQQIDQEYLKPGVYVVRMTLRQTVRVEEGTQITESMLLEDVLDGSRFDIVDWQVKRGD
jgi:hypothetical protein